MRKCLRPASLTISGLRILVSGRTTSFTISAGSTGARMPVLPGVPCSGLIVISLLLCGPQAEAVWLRAAGISGGTGKDGMPPGKVAPVRSRGGGELGAEEAQLGRVGDDVDRLDHLAAHGEHQHARELAATEAEHRGLGADRMGNQRGTRSPEVQQVPGDAYSSSDH